MIRVVTQISYKEVRNQTCHIFTMRSILFTVLLCLFSVHVTECTEIQDETIYTYNYDNKFGDIFHQGDMDDFNMIKYDVINPILRTAYEGPHIGGAFMMEGNSYTTTKYFKGYIVDISTTQYCGTNYGIIYMQVYYTDGESDRDEICGDDWNYNHTWIPLTRFSHSDQFRVQIHSYGVDLDHPNGFDEIKIRTTDVPPPTTKSPSASIPAIVTSMTP